MPLNVGTPHSNSITVARYLNKTVLVAIPALWSCPAFGRVGGKHPLDVFALAAGVAVDGP